MLRRIERGLIIGYIDQLSVEKPSCDLWLQLCREADSIWSMATDFGELIEPIGDFALLRLHLDTGRTHQIRVHLQAIGHPVCGDPEYGTGGRDSILGLQRQFLHATRLAFPHPVTGERIEVSSPLPEDLQSALERARGRS